MVIVYLPVLFIFLHKALNTEMAFKLKKIIQFSEEIHFSIFAAIFTKLYLKYYKISENNISHILDLVSRLVSRLDLDLD